PPSAAGAVCRFWRVQARLLLRTRPALQHPPLEVGHRVSLVVPPDSSWAQLLPRRTDASHGLLVESELAGRDHALLPGAIPRPARNGRLPAILLLVRPKPRITAAELVVRHVRIDPVLLQVGHVGLVGKAGIGR